MASRTAGFTLIELLTVLAVLALMTAIAGNSLTLAAPGIRLKAAARVLADDLRSTRHTAMIEGQEADLVIWPDRYLPGGGTPAQELPKGARLQLVAVAGRPGGEDRIKFFADGSSTGGRIELTLGGHRRKVAVDWLTGRVDGDE
jgi:general secretion pathway protein H